jgi:hypothetical protein
MAILLVIFVSLGMTAGWFGGLLSEPRSEIHMALGCVGISVLSGFCTEFAFFFRRARGERTLS